MDTTPYSDDTITVLGASTADISALTDNLDVDVSTEDDNIVVNVGVSNGKKNNFLLAIHFLYQTVSNIVKCIPCF